MRGEVRREGGQDMKGQRGPTNERERSWQGEEGRHWGGVVEEWKEVKWKRGGEMGAKE